MCLTGAPLPLPPVCVCVFICVHLKHGYTKSILSAYLHACMCPEHVGMMFDMADRCRRAHRQASRGFNV